MAVHPDLNPYPDNAPEENQARAASIDRSARFPVLFFFTAGIFWLFVGAAIGMLAYFKFRNPNHLTGDLRTLFGLLPEGSMDFIPREWADLAPLTTWGKLKPAFQHVLMYGWACSAAFGAGLWIIARMCRTKLPAAGFLVIGGHLWHLGVLVGLLGIIFSGPTSFEWLEMSGATAVILFLAYLPVAFAGFWMIFNRESKGNYISMLFIAGALFWFPWVFGLGNLLLRGGTMTGVLLPIVNFWYMDAFAFLFLAPMALGAAYYLVPNITGRPLSHYRFGTLAFWLIAFLGGMMGLRHLAGFPVGQLEWLNGVSVAAGLLMMIPALLIAMTFIKPVREGYALFSQSVPLRFVVIGICAFFVTHTLGSLLQVDAIERYTQFTLAIDGHFYLVVYAFPTLVFFGAIYYIMPKVLGYEWHSAKLVEFHYWVTLFATIFLVVFMYAGGAAQGAVLQEPNNFISTVVQQAMQVTFMGNLFWIAIVIANLVFLYNLLRSLFQVYNPGPGLIDSLRPGSAGATSLDFRTENPDPSGAHAKTSSDDKSVKSAAAS
jgi:cytochrome c oxidase cbb3-type subunit 1